MPAAPAAAAGRAAPGGVRRTSRRADGSYRAEYHFTVPDQWMNDPQRPIWIDGEYHYYYLYNPDYFTGGPPGTAWRLATSTDLVSFRDRGIAVPKTTPIGDVWSGCAVVDTGNTAGLGPGAVVVVATADPGNSQAQYLFSSTDDGRSFTPYGTGPVLPNPGVVDFRDPKIIRDEERGRWVMVLAENNKLGFYHSPDLKSWTYVGGFIKDGVGVFECPDLFRITAADGTARWVLGASANGRAAGLPNTYAYWTGAFDGTTFTPDAPDPQWLDHGFDWYAAVTFDRHRADGSVDPATRYAIGWMNNWAYAGITPTIDSDGFNGTDSIVREITLRRDAAGTLYLASRPVAGLDEHVSRTVALGDLRVEGNLPLDYRGTAYELSTEITWDQLTGAGMQLRRSADGARHIDAGIWADYAFVNRGGVANPDQSGTMWESRSPFDPAARRVTMRVLVDRTTVEVFFDDGRYTHSLEAFPYLTDTGLALFAVDGPAVFRNTVIREFTV
ncbi:glycoside hydrolase family 32 protein [Streptomyces sp. DSM 44938]|uniref:Glycoside hydrolase family 32 protein n=1 Tax=Streptomyces litchfieldiae TaxID=3075543 RepID=A0ABU2MTU8_9ACTN|nr:glycoside hydrolase family 32 protein [Streptomyces sp. DSM 44938]MDT0345066.1 glycoside hydrolase family 32 protein [Streptomyces sp. DSM 44938]